ncbi:PAS domain-containing protein [Arenibacter algicola]|uniref:PAS domain-containing protein n=1 Tax=Arenibacter algicola TaxID=616991 RepID=UPI001C06DB23|nr:PAS domain S-box protein [Arenibacter algicola]MBU2905966.1 PAS domain-containing protein [Arenibacter algicola]
MKSGIYTHKKKDGELVKMEIVGQHLVLDQIKCILVTCNDVTDREAYLNNLKQSELKLKSATTIAKLGYWSVDPIDLSFVCSDEFYKIWGRNPETFNFSFETFKDTIHPEDKDVLTSENDKAILQKRKYEVVYRITLPDNSIKWIQHVGQPINGPDGNYTKLEGTVQDITDLKSTQLQIEKTNEEKNNILESIGDAFISVDHNWTVTYWNSVAEKVLMVEKDDIMGKNLWNVMENHIDSKAFLKYYKSIYSGNTIYFQDYFSSFNKWLEVSAYPSENNLSLYIRDISDKQHSEFAIQKQNDKLREIAWTQSHVVRAPLARLMGVVDLFREGLLDENEKKPMLDHIYTSAIELDDIIQEIVSKSQSVISNE